MIIIFIISWLTFWSHENSTSHKESVEKTYVAISEIQLMYIFIGCTVYPWCENPGLLVTQTFKVSTVHGRLFYTCMCAYLISTDGVVRSQHNSKEIFP